MYHIGLWKELKLITCL